MYIPFVESCLEAIVVEELTNGEEHTVLQVGEDVGHSGGKLKVGIIH
jgi:hypothetical protein